MNYVTRVEVDKDLGAIMIESGVEYPNEPLLSRFSMQMIQTKDKLIREGLKQLGWIPPEEAAAVPTVHVVCETRSNGLAGTMPLNVIRVEREDDGAFTAVTDHWPSSAAAGAEELARCKSSRERWIAMSCEFEHRLETLRSSLWSIVEHWKRRADESEYGPAYASCADEIKAELIDDAATPPSASSTAGEAVAYFAADPAVSDFGTYKTLAEARDAAQKLLDYAAEDALEAGWADEPPQVCYGIVLAGCEEIPESRKPAPEGSDFTEVVEYRLTTPPSASSTHGRERAALREIIAVLGPEPPSGLSSGAAWEWAKALQVAKAAYAAPSASSSAAAGSVDGIARLAEELRREAAEYDYNSDAMSKVVRQTLLRCAAKIAALTANGEVRGDE